MEVIVKKDLAGRIHDLFLHNDLADVKFNLNYDNKITEVSGHRLLFGIGSRVLREFLFEEQIDRADTINIDGIPPDGFISMKRYLYTDEVSLVSLHDALATYVAAKRYDLHFLCRRIEEDINSAIAFHNVLQILEFFQLHGNEDIVYRCKTFIKFHCEKIVESEEFLDCHLRTLEYLVEQDTLCVSEINLFKGVNAWAKHNIQRSETEEQKDEIRRSISSMIKKIRFLCMAWYEFAEEPRKSHFLNNEEGINLLGYLCRPGSCNIPQGYSISTIYRNPNIQPRKQMEIAFYWRLESVFVLNHQSGLKNWSNTFYLDEKPWQVIIKPKPILGDKLISLYLVVSNGGTN